MKGSVNMESKTLKDAIHSIKMFSTYLNEDNIDMMKLFVSALFNIDVERINLMLEENRKVELL
jgi:hypothetical protein